MKKLYFATSNEDKAKEAQLILEMPIEIVKLELEEIQSNDLKKIVERKAMDAYKKVQAPVFVDDVALYVEAWNGFPGPFIRYLQDAGGNELFLKMLKNETNRRVKAVVAIGFCNGIEVTSFMGENEGKISEEARGNGWGFNPIFIPSYSDKTYGELPEEEKNNTSHRRKALDTFKEYLTRIKEK